MRSMWKTVWQFLKNLNIELPGDLAIPLLRIYPREMKTYVHTKTCIQIFTAALFILAKSRNNSNVHQLMNKQNVVYSHNGILLGHKKDWITDTCYNMDEPQVIMLHEEDKYRRPHIIWFHLYEISRTGKSTQTEIRLVVPRGLGVGIMWSDY